MRRSTGRPTPRTSRGSAPKRSATIGELTKAYPKSRYLQDAKALEVEVRRDSGQPVRPENESDEEMKLLVLNGLQSSAPDEAIPMLQKFLPGHELAQAEGARPLRPRAEQFAQGARDHRQHRQGQLDAGSADEGHPVPRAFTAGRKAGPRWAMSTPAARTSTSSGASCARSWSPERKERLLAAAQTEQNSELRMEAVRQLGVMGAHDELWTLYQKESSRGRQKADSPGHVRRRQRDTADRPGEDRTESRTAPPRGQKPGPDRIASAPATRSSRSTARRRIPRSRSRRSTRSSSRTTPKHWSPSHGRSRTSP